ncbi:class I SAM-dependent methyltransferase [Neisseria iguanae]|uniref:rRNA methyltransferase n=1 Tax=Neisseria iguanae TaxID=90242 RepID=A0A2P7U3F4_9NEIS|nr:class I SAM-dependent methyltransferase [Neisseria iguanae]PSJ81500.1 rRNA methyltransferase [Neisseria iguanae]
MPIQNILPFTHQLLASHLQNGDIALDGTAGNGHDTVFLAEAVGNCGKVWAFDVQKQATEQTKARLMAENLLSRVALVHDSHQYIERYICQGLDAAVFNFGWLPGGDKNVTTLADSSLAALNSTLSLLNPNGIVVAVLYPGHDSGRAETEAIEAWAQSLPQQEFAVLKYHFINRQNHPPYMLAIQKLR